MKNRADRRKKLRNTRIRPDGCFGGGAISDSNYDKKGFRIEYKTPDKPKHVSNRKVIKRLRKQATVSNRNIVTTEGESRT